MSGQDSDGFRAAHFQRLGDGRARGFLDNIIGEDRATRVRQNCSEAFQKFVQGVSDLWGQFGGQAPNQAKVQAMVPEEISMHEMKLWQRELRTECHRIERDIAKLWKEDSKLQKDIQALVNRGDTASAQYVATQLIRGREAAERLQKTKLSMTSAYMALTTQMATAQGVGALKRSTCAMHHMNGAIRGHEMSGVVKCMQKEMDSVQMAHEVVDDAFQNFHNEEDEVFLRDCEIAKSVCAAESRTGIRCNDAASLMARIDHLDNGLMPAKSTFAHGPLSFSPNGSPKNLEDNWDDVSSLMDRINNL